MRPLDHRLIEIVLKQGSHQKILSRIRSSWFLNTANTIARDLRMERSSAPAGPIYGSSARQSHLLLILLGFSSRPASSPPKCLTYWHLFLPGLLKLIKGPVFESIPRATVICSSSCQVCRNFKWVFPYKSFAGPFLYQTVKNRVCYLSKALTSFLQIFRKFKETVPYFFQIVPALLGLSRSTRLSSIPTSYITNPLLFY